MRRCISKSCLNLESLQKVRSTSLGFQLHRTMHFLFVLLNKLAQAERKDPSKSLNKQNEKILKYLSKAGMRLAAQAYLGDTGVDSRPLSESKYHHKASRKNFLFPTAYNSYIHTMLQPIRCATVFHLKKVHTLIKNILLLINSRNQLRFQGVIITNHRSS